MSRFLSIAALSLSLCALVVALFLWREVHAWRRQAASQPLQHRLTDEQFARIKSLAEFMHVSFDEGHVPRSDVLTADQLLNKARYMHGDISREEWHRLSDEAEPEQMRLHVARLKAGVANVQDILLLYDDVLESSR